MATSRIVDHVGRVLSGRYRLVAPIGTGASAHVFLAEDVTLRRSVAVKVLHAALARDEAFLRRFRAEAQVAAGLNHPHIMRVFDWGEDDDGPFLVLEHLAGGSLRDLLDGDARLTVAQACRIGLEAARALDHAHRRGLVHRDIKPANLLFDDEGRMCVADFGLARALAEAAWTEPAGAVLGTARYASPEQAQGASVTGRSDVYALALTLVEAVTGRVPFAADTTIATLMARVGARLDPSEELGRLGPVLVRAAAPDPDERPDASELVLALEGVARELPPPAQLPLAGRAATAPERPVHDDHTELGRRPALYDHEADARRRGRVPAPGGTSGDAEQPAVLPAARRRRRWPWVALVLVVLAAAGAGGYAFVQSRVPSHPVPALAGVSFEEARARAAGGKFRLVVADRRHDEQAPADTVLEQRPAAGMLKEGGAIRVVLSRGPPPRPVPAVVGKPRAEAEKLLAESGFAVKVATDFSETVAKGLVLAASPEGVQPKGTEVVVTVSEGPRPRPVPDVGGKTFDEAAAALRDAGFVPARRDVFDDEVPPGRVVETSPSAGSSVVPGTRVTIAVSKGPEEVPVPDVRGKTVAEATAQLQAAGLVRGSVYGPPRATRVIDTSPGAGAKVKRGSSVDLYVKP